MSKGKFPVFLVLALALAALLPRQARAVDPCDWDSQARPADYEAIMVLPDGLDEIIYRIPAQSSEDARLALGLLKRARHSLPLGNISGQWRIRSIQGEQFGRDHYMVFAYPAFRARIDAASQCGQFFQKTTGSQRRSGYLYPIAGRDAMAFLGGATVNDDPLMVYDPDRDSPSNTAGQLIRIGANELLMVLDARPAAEGERSFELYYLQK